MTKTDGIYDQYFNNLIKGKRIPCSEILDSLISSEFNVHNIYIDLFQKGLYQVGRMWEHNKISVATEHLATSITENLMNRVYEKIPIVEPVQKKVVIGGNAVNCLKKIKLNHQTSMFETFTKDMIRKVLMAKDRREPIV